MSESSPVDVDSSVKTSTIREGDEDKIVSIFIVVFGISRKSEFFLKKERKKKIVCTVIRSFIIVLLILKIRFRNCVSEVVLRKKRNHENLAGMFLKKHYKPSVLQYCCKLKF